MILRKTNKKQAKQKKINDVSPLPNIVNIVILKVNLQVHTCCRRIGSVAAVGIAVLAG